MNLGAAVRLDASGEVAWLAVTEPRRGHALGMHLNEFTIAYIVRQLHAIHERASPPAHAISLANRAHSVDPFLIEPYWAKALAAEQRNDPPRVAFAYYVQAVHRQPANPATWLAAGEYAFGIGCYQSAYTYLERYTELDQKARSSDGGDDYNAALKRVNAGKGVC